MNITTPWKIVVSLICLFLLGVATGATILHTLQQRVKGHVVPERDWATRELRVLEARLELQPLQVERLRPVLSETAQDMRQVRMATARQLAELIHRNSSQVLLLLNDAQKKRFQDLINERQIVQDKPHGQQ
jgi:hypothetical protein